MQELSQLRQDFAERGVFYNAIVKEVGELKTDILSIKERMNVYEQQAKENNATLARIEHTVNSYEQALAKASRLVKWMAGVIVTAIVGEGLIYLIHLIHP
jgi:uncharacterized protein YlxW (UPF0749 family)